MSFRNSIYFISLAAGFFAAATALAEDLPDRVPGQWIVELQKPATAAWLMSESAQAKGSISQPNPRSRDARRGLDLKSPSVSHYVEQLGVQRQITLAQAAHEFGRSLRPLAEFNHVTNGVLLELSDLEAARLARLPGVRSVRPNRIERLTLTAGPELTGARALGTGLDNLPPASGEGTIVGILDTGIDWDHHAFSDDPAHSGGYVYSNPYSMPLGLCGLAEVGCNDKLVGVYDFTEEGVQGRDTGGHGTHVASIAAGNDWAPGMAGVAPRAQVISYKICVNPTPGQASTVGCLKSARLQALDQALIDGVDVINYSGAFRSPTNPWTGSQSMLDLREAGILFVSSAGNNGPDNTSLAPPADAPWVIGVGSSTHRERVGRRAQITNAGSWPIFYGDGPDLTAFGIHNAPLISGSEAGGTLNGCQPYTPLAMADSVALLQRGECSFSTKVSLAEQAGARAVMIFDNVPGFPFALTGLSETGIPAGLVSLEDGLHILAALNAASQPLRVTLRREVGDFSNALLEDRVSVFSTRGPGAFTPNVMKPNLVAPGEHILAAHVTGPQATLRRNGTSMSTPHVAGAVALLRQLHPDWRPDQIQSALETTAETTPLTYGDRSASARERGNGRLRVDQAALAALYLPVDREAFLAANPAEGGDPRSLNLAGILLTDCPSACSATRTVRAMQAGSWNVSVQGSLELSVSPASFSLQAGEEQHLDIQIQPGLADDLEALIDGRIILTPSAPDQATQALTVAAGRRSPPIILPRNLTIRADANRGQQFVQIPSVSAMPEARLQTSGLKRPVVEQFTLAQDQTPGNPFSSGPGTRTFLFDVPDDQLMVFVEVVATTSSDIDFLIGHDDNGDGLPSPDEAICGVLLPGNQGGACTVRHPRPGRWWIQVQNWEASAPDAEDTVELEYAVLANEPTDYSLVANGPGYHDGGTLDISLSWDQPAMKGNQRRIGAIALSSSPDQVGDIAVVPVVVERQTDLVPQPTALFNDQTLDVVLAPGMVHDRLFIDVPPTALGLEVTIQGDDGIDAELQVLDFGELIGAAPDTPPAPPGALTSGSGSAQGFTLSTVFSGMTPGSAAGRYYVRLTNPSSHEKAVRVSASVVESDRIDTRFGLWSPQGRLTFQGLEWQQAGPGFVIWYSYDETGLPVFYIATANIDEDSSIWQATLERVIGNNIRQTPEVVGEISLTGIDADTLLFAWRLNGGHGSEIMMNDVPPTCAELDGNTLSFTGHWFSPDQPAGGMTTLVTDSGQFYIRYFYDLLGVGRWVFLSATAASQGLGDQLEARDFRGFCPNCPPFAMTFDDSSSAAGGSTVIFDDESAASQVLDLVLAPPLDHTISLELAMQKLSERLNCP